MTKRIMAVSLNHKGDFLVEIDGAWQTLPDLLDGLSHADKVKYLDQVRSFLVESEYFLRQVPAVEQFE